LDDLIFGSDFLTFAAGPVEPAFALGAGFEGLVSFLGADLVVFAPVFGVAFVEAFGLPGLLAALLAALAFLVFGSGLEAAFEEAFFGATVAFANLTSCLFLDFGNY
jgi:hypothetical protein